MKTAMVKRIIFGTAMTAALLLVFVLEWSIERYLSSEPATGAFREMLFGLPILAVVCALLVVGFFELNTLAKAASTKLLVPSGLIGVILITALPNLCLPYTLDSTSPYLASLWESLMMLCGNKLLIVSLVVALVFLNQMCTRQAEGALLRIAATLLATAYLGVCGAMVISLRMEYGLGTFLVFLGAVKLTDVGAYFTGSMIGKHKIIRWLSPGKSWEGLIGGLVLAGLIGWVACAIRQRYDDFSFSLSLVQALTFCLILGVVGQFGDLCESLLKRSAGVKDAGRLVPQFGGVLDIIDSPLIAAPIAHVLLLFF